jgi:hypothetical protein
MKKSHEDLFELYFQMQLNRLEPPAIFHRWALIGVMGAWLNRQCWLPFGSGKIFPNQYIMFIGEAGTRKSTAIKEASKILQRLGYASFAPKKTSKEQYLADLTGSEEEGEEESIDAFSVLDTDTDVPRESFINADEFNVFLGMANLEFQDILGDMWDWDEPEKHWEYRLKNSRHVRIFQPTISILGGNTPNNFLECFPPASIGRGFLSRMVLIYGEKTGKKITFPKDLTQQQKDAMTEAFATIKQEVHGAFSISPEAEQALDLIYKSWPDMEDSRFTHYGNRRFIHLLKLCMIHSAARISTTVQIVDVVKANTVLAYAETQMPKAMGELGKSRTSEAAHKMMQALYGTRSPMTVADLWHVVRSDLEKPADLSQVINNLLAADKIQTIDLPGKKQGYLPKQKGIDRKVLYVDPTLLKGKELP